MLDFIIPMNTKNLTFGIKYDTKSAPSSPGGAFSLLHFPHHLSTDVSASADSTFVFNLFSYIIVAFPECFYLFKIWFFIMVPYEKINLS